MEYIYGIPSSNSSQFVYLRERDDQGQFAQDSNDNTLADKAIIWKSTGYDAPRAKKTEQN